LTNQKIVSIAPHFIHGTDWIGQLGDFSDAVSHLGDPLFCQQQTI